MLRQLALLMIKRRLKFESMSSCRYSIERAEWLGVLHHEIGSHFLRRFNEIQQPWHNEQKKIGLKSTVTIEEGSLIFICQFFYDYYI